MPVELEKDESTKYDYIDSLRGVAILLVIMVHTAQRFQIQDNWIDSITKFGQMGVILFFCISSITLCMSMEKKGWSKIGIKQFYIKRYFRIAPLYYVGIIFYFLTTQVFNYLNPSDAILHQQYSIINILANVFFIHNLYSPANNVIVPGGWSIGVEMLFYLIFPFIYFINKRIKNKILFLLLPILSFISSYLFFYLGARFFSFDLSNDTFWYFNILNHLPVFFLSIFYYFTINKKKEIGIRKYPHVIFCFLLIIMSIYLFNNNYSIVITPFVTSIAFLYLIFLFKEIKLLNVKPLMIIGQYSYSMYLFHFLFAIQISQILASKILFKMPVNLTFLICYLFSVSAAFLIARYSKKYIEDKGILLGRKIILKYLK